MASCRILWYPAYKLRISARLRAVVRFKSARENHWLQKTLPDGVGDHRIHAFVKSFKEFHSKVEDQDWRRRCSAARSWYQIHCWIDLHLWPSEIEPCRVLNLIQTKATGPSRAQEMEENDSNFDRDSAWPRISIFKSFDNKSERQLKCCRWS